MAFTWVPRAEVPHTHVYIEVPVPSKECEQSGIYVLGVSILPLSIIFLLEFGTVWYSLFATQIWN